MEQTSKPFVLVFVMDVFGSIIRTMLTVVCVAIN